MNLGQRFASSLAIAALLGLGSACAPPTTVVAAPTASSLTAGEGVVLVSLTANTARSGQFGSLEVRRAEAPGQPVHDYLLTQVSEGLSRDTSLFIGSLPPGEYTFSRLHAGQQFVALGQGSQALLGRFRVEADQTVDLGRIILTGLNSKILLGRSVKAMDNGDLLRAVSPDRLPLLERKKGEGWLAPRGKDDLVEAYAQSQPVGADGLTELAEGYVAGGSRMGMLLVRHPAGRWAPLATGRLSSLLSLCPWEGAGHRLVAAGEFLTLVRVGLDWKVTAIDPGNLPPGNLFFITGSEARGWVVGHQSGRSLTFFRSAKLEGGNWKPLRQETVKDSIWSGRNQVWAWPTPRGFAYATTFGGMQAFDREKEAWSRIQVPGDRNILGVSIQERWALLTSPGGGFAGIFATEFTSTDQGGSWVELKGPFNAKLQPPCVMPGGRILQQGGIGKPELQLSEDGGATWTLVSDKIAVRERLVATPTQGVFAVDDGGGSFGFASIRRSTDAGRAWQLELTNFNRAAYDREHPPKP